MMTTRGKQRKLGKITAMIALFATMALLCANAAVAEDEAAKKDKGDKKKDREAWIPLFNGEDLSGWKAEGNASWKVEDGILIGVQGPGGAAGDLFTEKDYDDYRLKVTFKMEWPANSGVWFRYQSEEKAYQADILEYKNPECYSGTLYCPGRMFLAMNTDPNLVKRNDWNTLVISAKGDHLQIMLNGKQVADVRDDAMLTGKIGFQIHAGDEFNNMKLMVREVLLRPVKK